MESLCLCTFMALFAIIHAQTPSPTPYRVYDDVDCPGMEVVGLEQVLSSSQVGSGLFNVYPDEYSANRRIWRHGAIYIYFSERWVDTGEWIISNGTYIIRQQDPSATAAKNNSVPTIEPPGGSDGEWDHFQSDDPWQPTNEITLYIECFDTAAPTSSPTAFVDPSSTEDDDGLLSGTSNKSKILGIETNSGALSFLVILLTLCVICLFLDGLRRLILKLKAKKEEIEKDEKWMTAGMTEEQKEAAMAGVASAHAVRRATRTAMPPSPAARNINGHVKAYTFSQGGSTDDLQRVTSTSTFKVSVEMANGSGREKSPLNGSVQYSSDKPPPKLSLPGTVVTIEPPKGMETPVAGNTSSSEDSAAAALAGVSGGGPEIISPPAGMKSPEEGDSPNKNETAKLMANQPSNTVSMKRGDSSDESVDL